MKQPIILDTDIGTDVDDAWALGLCLASTDLDLVGVTLVHGDLDTRAKIALKFLRLAGRPDVPVYAGEASPITDGKGIVWAGHEGTETDFSDIEGISAHPDGVRFILDTVRRSPGEVIVCSIGPLTNIAEAVRREPQTMAAVKKLVAMVGDYRGEGGHNASREHNGCVDPAATRIVLECGIPATVVGLNVTMRVTVSGEDLLPLQGWPLGDYLAAMSRQYMRIVGRDILYMHDPLAVATIVDQSLVTCRQMGASVLDDGRIAWRPGGPIDVCDNVDSHRFVQLLRSNIYSLRDQGD